MRRAALIERAGVVSIPKIETLTLEDVERLPVGWWSKLSAADIAEAVATYPRRSQWVRDSREYAVVAPWRHRTEIAAVAELQATSHPHELAKAALDASLALGAELAVFVETEERRLPEFYVRIGCDLLESVVVYDADPRRRRPRIENRGVNMRVVDPYDRTDRSILMSLDHDAFPWLWRNSEKEFGVYFDLPGVEVFLLERAEEPVGYIGLTTFLGWGHVDRVAVRSDQQGQGLGTFAVDFALRRLAELGAMSVGLSTQERNLRSRRVYEALGFRLSRGSEYRLYGRWADPVDVEPTHGGTRNKMA